MDFIYNRPKNLSGDKVPKIDVIKNLIRNYQNFDKHQKIDLVVDLDVTVPSRAIKDIKGAKFYKKIKIPLTNSYY